MTEAEFVPLAKYREYSVEEMKDRAAAFYEDISRRRTVREFSDRPVPQEIIEHCILAAGTALNGANLQPWHFVAISDPEVKRTIRQAAEEEEHEFYSGRAPQESLDALAHLGPNENKPFLEPAPYLIVVFSQRYGILPEGKTIKHYYATESVGIATRMLITAVHNAGLVSLTHTPSPMTFLNEMLGRPENERPFLILVVGYPAEDANVPTNTKKPLAEIATFV